MHRNWISYMIATFSVIGAFATWSRWCWLPEILGNASKALGLHFFEGWLVFLFLGFAAGLQLVRIKETNYLRMATIILPVLAPHFSASQNQTEVS